MNKYFSTALVFISAFFLFSCGNDVTENKTTEIKTEQFKIKNEDPFVIMVQPLGTISSEKIKFIQKEIQQFYNCDTVLTANKLDLPKMAWYEPRQRYVADSLLVFLKNKKPDNVQYVIGITEKDIATEKDKNPNYGIMGLGFCPGPCCVVSTFRLHKRLRQAQSDKKIEQIFLDRFSKVCLHELGHNLGLPHCAENDSCFMNDADGTISQVDKERKYICAACRKKITL